MSSDTARRRPALRGEGARLRDEIIEAAMRLTEHAEDPWALSLRAVAREVGVATTSIYLHFDSLDELLMAMKTAFYERFGAALQEAAAGAGPTPYEQIRAYGDGYLAFARTYPGAYKALFTTTLGVTQLVGEQYPGRDQFEMTVKVLRQVPLPAAEARQRAVLLWCAIHGLVSLTDAVRRFPWPPEGDLLDGIARQVTRPLE